MFGSVILDVAIGMVFIYLLLSLVASVINEALASLVQSRAANLQRGLRSLLSGDSIEAGPLTLVDNIYTHGLVRGLYQDPAKDFGGSVSWGHKIRLKLQRLARIAPVKPIDGVSDQLLLPAYIPARTFALAMIDILNKDKFNGKTPMENIENFLSSHHQQFENNKAVEALLTLLIDAKNDVQESEKKLQALQTNLENWFNDGMDRVAGWYKRYTQNVLMVIGLGLAIAFNVDSIRVAHMLWVDRDARQGMVDAATDYLQRHPAPPPSNGQANPSAPADSGAVSSGPNPDTQNQPASSDSDGQAKAATPTVPGTAYSEKDLTTRMELSVKAVNDVTGKYLLPVGWRHQPREYWQYFDTFSWGMVRTGFLALAGWLITAGALSLGASFWFDMLNKIMVIRNTVKPQEKSQIEGSKDN